jgi:hypothetical protein
MKPVFRLMDMMNEKFFRCGGKIWVTSFLFDHENDIAVWINVL